MSKRTTHTGKSGTKTKFQVKPVYAAEVASIILEELSRNYGDCCNYLEAAGLVRSQNPYLALASIEQQNSGRDVQSPRQHWVHSQALAAVKKLVDPGIDRWSLTKEKWFKTEERSRKLNQKFQALHNRRVRGVKPLPFPRELYRFYEGLLHVLGEAPPIDDILEEAHYGPGSTISIRGREVHYARKLEAEECVPSAVDLAARSLLHDKAVWAHIGLDPTYSHVESAQEGFVRVMRERLQAKCVVHDRLMFIHKNIDSLRSIGAQPTCSGMLQLGVHSVVAPMLKTIGVDLADQSWNQEMAKRGSLAWESENPICTLDKTDASNLQVKNLIVFLYPPAWAKLLMRIRTPGYEAPPEFGGGTFDYEMYAGMGNGTTFVVETLTFWAAAYATSEYATVEEFVKSKEFAVYGDDVALPRSHATRYMRFAQFLGFRFNMKKTFLDGPFRESCGADFYAGVAVRPATVDSETGILTMQDLIGIHNTLADNRTFSMEKACGRIVRLFKERMYPLVPTDPAGNLGFRPLGERSVYDIVRDNQGKAILSSVWHRPRSYILSVKPQFADLGVLDPWTQIAVSLLRARQSESAKNWSLPVRKLVSIRVIAEQDLQRRDLGLMLKNQLARLAVLKSMPWWEESRGT